jgi:hypothetical protein
MTAAAEAAHGPALRGARSGLRDPAVLGLGFVYTVASLGLAQKYLDTAAALALVALTPLIAMAAGAALEIGRARRCRASADLLAVAICAGLVIALLVVYPHVNTHVAGAGTDRDDAATIGARGFLDGRNPYGTDTYLGNPISQLPGLLAIAVPFVWLFHWSAYELVLWLPLAYLLWRAMAPAHGRALALLAIACSSPALLRDFLTGGDLLPNVVFVAGAAWLAGRCAGRPIADVPAAALLGVALSSRANYLFVLVPLLASIRLRRSDVTALRVGAVSLGVCAAITLPFALTHGGREALRVSDKLSGVPGGGVAVVAAGLVAAVALAVRWPPRSLVRLFGQAAAIQLLFVVALVLSRSVREGRLDFFPLVSGYGMPVLLLYATGLSAG